MSEYMIKIYAHPRVLETVKQLRVHYPEVTALAASLDFLSGNRCGKMWQATDNNEDNPSVVPRVEFLLHCRCRSVGEIARLVHRWRI